MKHKRYSQAAVFFLIAFILWTVATATLDVQAIGPEGTVVGLATINGYIHNRIGVQMHLYILTDRLSLLPLFFVAGFGSLGLVQWIRRKSLQKVDPGILVLGGFYLATGAAFLFFEKCIINYRPVLIEGLLEASYPSSTTMLVICVMSTSAMQLHQRIRNKTLSIFITFLIFAFTIFMVMCRFLSGVHWFSDIIGGILLSSFLVTMYGAIMERTKTKRDR